ncbi:MAG: DUF3106 domain-containing protein [Ignavibacteriota bacterium]
MMCPIEAGESALLLDYVAGRLKAGVRQQMEQHIETCHACREFAGGQQSLWQALDAWEPHDVSLDFDRRLYQRIEQDVPWWHRWIPSLNPLFRHSVPIAAAAGVVILAGLLLNRPADVPPAPVSQSAQVEVLQPDQLQSALEEMETLREFNHLVPDHAGPQDVMAMRRILHVGGLWLLAIGSVCGSDQAAKDTLPRAKSAASNGGVPKQQPVPKGAARLLNPAVIAARLFRMSSEEREHALEKLPNERQRENARKLLAWFDELPKEAQEIQLRRLDNFAKLTPEKRAEVRGLMAEVNALPPRRSAAVRLALYQLQQMTDRERDATLAEELRVIRGLADAWMGSGGIALSRDTAIRRVVTAPWEGHCAGRSGDAGGERAADASTILGAAVVPCVRASIGKGPAAKVCAAKRLRALSYLDEMAVTVVDHGVCLGDLIGGLRRLLVENHLHGAVAKVEIGEMRHVEGVHRVVQEDHRRLRANMETRGPQFLDRVPGLRRNVDERWVDQVPLKLRTLPNPQKALPPPESGLKAAVSERTATREWPRGWPRLRQQRSPARRIRIAPIPPSECISRRRPGR